MELWGTKRDGRFKTGQSYDDKPAKTIYCKKCKGDKFYVGAGSHWTGIICVTCGWEEEIHSG